MAELKNVTINDTGFLKIASGTTAQRPGTPVAGMIRYNTSVSRNEIYDGEKWVLFEGSAYATGGTVTTAGGYRIHTFTANGTLTMTYPGVVEVLLVGGGGGGATIGGGGGAGGFVYESQVQLPNAGAYTVTRGGGGSGTPTHPQAAGVGGTTSLYSPTPTAGVSISARGGGRGMSYTNATGTRRRNADGGSGGGGPGGHLPAPEGGYWPHAPAGHGASPINHWHNGPLQGTPTGNVRDQISNESNGYGGGTMGQGHPGGSGAHGNGFNWATNTVVHNGGGGGGAGASGKPGTNSNSVAVGGSGLASQISGAVTYYSGGGGGGTHGPGNAGHYGRAGAQGGVGGGATAGSNGVAGGTGGTNTGGGGGGGFHPSPNAAGSGGPGIVIVRYRDV